MPAMISTVQHRTDTVKLLLRLAKKTRKAVKQAAQRAGQSQNLWIALAIQRKLDQRDPAKGACHNTEKRTDIVPLILRVDGKMYDAIKLAATKAGQSQNLWAVLAIQQMLDQRG